MTTPSILEADSGAPEAAEKWPSGFFLPTLKTGTVDDDDDPAGERADENEASVREQNANIVATEAYQRDDEDRDGATPRAFNISIHVELCPLLRRAIPICIQWCRTLTARRTKTSNGDGPRHLRAVSFPAIASCRGRIRLIEHC